jgi:hypothetical protein
MHRKIITSKKEGKQQQLLRARSTEFLTIIIPATKTHLTWTENDCALLNHIESAIRNAACDKSSDVRKEAYPLYNAYKNTWPKRGEAFFSTLDMRTKKVLTNVEEKPSSPKVKKKKKTKRSNLRKKNINGKKKSEANDGFCVSNRCTER